MMHEQTHHASAPSDVLYLVGAGPGDPSLLTVRGAELLAGADVVLYDTLVPEGVLERAREGAELRLVVPGRSIAEHRQAGRRVVRLFGGDPFLFGRGAEEAQALALAGVPFEVVPGVASPLGATAYAGIPLVHRDLAQSVTLLAPAAGPASAQGTVCAVLSSVRELDALCRRLVGEAQRDPGTPAALVLRGTRPAQVVVEGRLDTVAALAGQEDGPGILVVGEVVALRRALRWFDARPLSGKRVLVTRPAVQARATSELLRRRGAEPIELPTIEIGPPPDPARVAQAARELDRCDVVVFTSENGVTWFFRALDAERRDARAFGRARVAAIGPGTAAALLSRGIRADIVPAEFRGEGLADAIVADPEVAARLARGNVSVLIPRALVARDVLGERLRAAGCEVTIVPVYETRPASVERRAALVRLLEARAIDAVMLTSSSTADSLCELVGPRTAELLRDVVVASIGPVTTKTAEQRGLTVGVTATTSTTAGVVASLEQHFGAAT